jgi:hypothetical protein
MLDRPISTPKQVVRFAPAPKEDIPNDNDAVEISGQAIIALLKEAADIANETCERAMDTAHQLAIKLRATEDRVKELETDVRQYQVRATQAEKWLLRIHKEIEDRFYGPMAALAPQAASSQRNQ